MIKHVIILNFLFILIWSCNKEQSNVCHLTGKLINAPDTTVLYLVNIETYKMADSMVIINGIIDYIFSTDHPSFFYLHNKRNKYPDRDSKYLWLEPSQINIEGDYEFLGNSKINGSLSQTEYDACNSILEKSHKRINYLKEQLLYKANEERKTDSLFIVSTTKNLSDSIVDIMLQYPSSYAVIYLLKKEILDQNRLLNKDQFRKIYDNLSDNLKKSENGKDIKKFSEIPYPPKVGDKVIDIVQTTRDGDTVRLSDFRGKYLLLDFWSSGCRGCRLNHKPLRKIYEKYKEYGFEIVGISHDVNEKHWINAIENDSIPWINIRNWGGWENDAFLLYDVYGLPRNFLIDPLGVMIKQDFHPFSKLEEELEKIFMEKRAL